MHSHHVPAYVEEVRRCFEEAYAEAHLQTSSKADRQKQYYDRVTSTVQLMLGDVVLINLDMFQDKRKVKDWWSEADYVVMCQVTDDMPTYEVLDDDGNVKVIHNNRLFLVAPTKEDATPWEEASLFQKRVPPSPPQQSLLHWSGEVKCQRVKWMRC